MPAPTSLPGEVGPRGRPTTYSVLLICTGNICRSPAAELLLAKALPGTGLAVESAGTHALTGEGVDPTMAALLEDEGVQTSSFRARQLVEDQIRRADLVLGLAREHRSAAVRLVPEALHRAFTLKELAQLLAKVSPRDLAEAAGPDAGSPRRMAAAVALAKRSRAASSSRLLDIEDPYAGSIDDFVATLAEIREAVRPLVTTALDVRR